MKFHIGQSCKRSKLWKVEAVNLLERSKLQKDLLEVKIAKDVGSNCDLVLEGFFYLTLTYT